MGKRFSDWFKKSWKLKFLLATSLAIIIIWIFCLPDPLFDRPLATVILDREGELLGASIARDQQWRIPAGDSISQRLLTAVVTFEDRRFYSHAGVDLKAIGRAIRDNLAAGTVVSGGSTISMQVIRLAQDNPPRTFWQKIKEIFLATRLEWSYSKDDILRLWCNNAPFGGNVVGVEAAAWRYYGRSAQDLSWSEAATLAVLPNSPALIHPGRSRQQLLAKRDRLLNKLLTNGHIDPTDYQLALEEYLPQEPYPLPRRAPHLLQRLKSQSGNGRHHSTISGELQDKIKRAVELHRETLAPNGIHNAAALVVEVASGAVVAYVGNAGDDPSHQPAVDMVTAPRSPGSLLKPVLYGLALSRGIISPKSLLPDYPVSFRGFRPANFSNDYNGAVAADEALSRSLNIPFVHLLKDYGIPDFHEALQNFHFSKIDRQPGHYGLSLILGGCEIQMEEIARWFTGLARQQRFFYARQGRYASDLDWAPLQLLQSESETLQSRRSAQPSHRYAGSIDAGAAHSVLEALTQLHRPTEAGDWRRFSSSREVAWKTGTSFGFRDAWAVGATPEYVVAVWVGNADGEGREGLVGVQAAAPLMFKIFADLPPAQMDWFEPPYDALVALPICPKSGMLAGQYCDGAVHYIPRNAERSRSCPFHQPIHLSADEGYRVRLDCAEAGFKTTTWFTLPTKMEHFYRRQDPSYRTIPAWSPACNHVIDDAAMSLIYPYNNGKISLSKDRNGQLIPAIFQAAHRYPQTQIHWHLDGRYIGSTSDLHTFEVIATPGHHQLNLVDTQGRKASYSFEVTP